ALSPTAPTAPTAPSARAIAERNAVWAARANTVFRPAAVAPAPDVHVLMDTDHEPSKKILSAGSVPGLTPRQQADSIVKSILAGGTEGPVVLCMPGTLGAAWETSILETARAVVQRWHGRGPLAVVSIPYNNGIPDIVKRFLGLANGEDRSVLAMVIRDIHAKAPNRPILLAGESQGSWVIGHDLEDPELAAAVTRVFMFSKPGFQKSPPTQALGTAAGAVGSARLPGHPGLIEMRHTDDIVPSLFSKLGLDVLTGYVLAFRQMAVDSRHHFGYEPHHYDIHGAEAAAYLLDGIVPGHLVHHSSDDR
ncbi:MAG: hypothetical protein H7123_04060, partial [Thermoleophilia bacterium]|nr:hypothetical protein [Thermoleophilia bacterium]